MIVLSISHNLHWVLCLHHIIYLLNFQFSFLLKITVGWCRQVLKSKCDLQSLKEVDRKFFFDFFQKFLFGPGHLIDNSGFLLNSFIACIFYQEAKYHLGHSLLYNLLSNFGSRSSTPLYILHFFYS